MTKRFDTGKSSPGDDVEYVAMPALKVESLTPGEVAAACIAAYEARMLNHTCVARGLSPTIPISVASNMLREIANRLDQYTPETPLQEIFTAYCKTAGLGLNLLVEVGKHGDFMPANHG